MDIIEPLFFDTETTGLGPEADVLEFAVVDSAGRVLLGYRCGPQFAEEWPEAQAVNGIAPADVAGLPTWAERYPAFLELVRGRELVIYNAPYDLQYCPGLEREAAAVRCCLRRFADWYRQPDPKRPGRWKWQRLALAAEVTGYPWPLPAHSAASDADATRHVWHWLDNHEHTAAGRWQPEEI
jgi:DNA polymerase-3 subunit epsilon